MAKNPTLSSVEEYVDFLEPLMSTEAANVPTFKRQSRQEFRDAVNAIEEWRYVQSGDHHYFVSRILFVNHVTEYGLFAAHQCIENYLKAYIKSSGQSPASTHNLKKLLEDCRQFCGDSDAFVHEKRIEVIIAKFVPFYETARYPVCMEKPDGAYALIIPDDIYVLDYFVYRMRQVLSIPDNTWDILKEGHFNLEMCKRNSPQFYQHFFAGNINFPEIDDDQQNTG